MKLLRKLLTCLLCLVLLASPALAQVLVEDGIALDDQAELLVETKSTLSSTASESTWLWPHR